MKAQLPHPEHYSYLRHRKERVTQIYLPMIITALLLVGLIVLISVSTFNQGGDVGRWAAISTMWLSTFILFGGLITLAILGGLVYLMSRLLSALPYYTGIAQDYVQIARGYILRGAEMVTKPIIAADSFLANFKAFFGRD
jgi:hypothetical protein